MPSVKVLENKKSIVSGLAEELKNAKTLVVADARGLTVSQDTELRSALRKAGVTYKVVKNTLISRAAKEVELGDLDEIFKGPTAIAFSADDVIAPAKVMKEFSDKFEKLNLKGGATEGRVATLAELSALASIPPLEVLYAQVVGGLVSPIAALAIYLNEIAKKMEAAGANTAADVAVGSPEKEEAPAAEAVEEKTEEVKAEAVEESAEKVAEAKAEATETVEEAKAEVTEASEEVKAEVSETVEEVKAEADEAVEAVADKVEEATEEKTEE